ncbi:hypothetical protein BH23PLA1_BH23PLA1_30310 [soil metagenome]
MKQILVKIRAVLGWIARLVKPLLMPESPYPPNFPAALIPHRNRTPLDILVGAIRSLMKKGRPTAKSGTSGVFWKPFPVVPSIARWFVREGKS